MVQIPSSLVKLDLEISLHLDLAIQIFCLLLLLGQVFSCEFKIYFHPTDKKRVWQDAVWGFRQTTTTVRRSSRCLDKRSLGVNLQPPISERNNQTLKPKFCVRMQILNLNGLQMILKWSLKLTLLVVQVDHNFGTINLIVRAKFYPTYFQNNTLQDLHEYFTFSLRAGPRNVSYQVIEFPINL